MNILAIKYNSASIKSQNNYNYNQKVSFYGSANLCEKFAKNQNDAKWGCLMVATLIAAPFLMLGRVISNIYIKKNKSDILNGIYMELGDSLNKTKYKQKTYFNEQKEKMINLLDKYSTNDNYRNFVKEVLEFLDKNFEQNMMNLDPPFNLKYYVDTIYNVADAAISKNKEFDTEVLDVRIKRTREAMQQFDKNNT